jgi:hypothetical protein
MSLSGLLVMVDVMFIDETGGCFRQRRVCRARWAEWRPASFSGRWSFRTKCRTFNLFSHEQDSSTNHRAAFPHLGWAGTGWANQRLQLNPYSGSTLAIDISSPNPHLALRCSKLARSDQFFLSISIETRNHSISLDSSQSILTSNGTLGANSAIPIIPFTIKVLWRCNLWRCNLIARIKQRSPTSST